jgi:hypothetical protein
VTSLPCSAEILAGRRYADFFSAAFTFAHRARCAAAIFLRAAADIVFFLGIATTFCFRPAFARTLAHRALCAAAILARAAAERDRAFHSSDRHPMPRAQHPRWHSLLKASSDIPLWAVRDAKPEKGRYAKSGIPRQ